MVYHVMHRRIRRNLLNSDKYVLIFFIFLICETRQLDKQFIQMYFVELRKQLSLCIEGPNKVFCS